jgi:Ankyrin repeats (3 copies)
MGGGKKKQQRELPPLFWYMESGEWEQAMERVRQHPRELKLWATLRTKGSDDNMNSAGGGAGRTSTTTKRLALHHACFKLRSAGAVPPPTLARAEDPYVAVCRFILILIRLYPEAASQRETRHGCLPLHLAAFATCAPRCSGEPQQQQQAAGSSSPTASTASTMSSSFDQHSSHSHHPPPPAKRTGMGSLLPTRPGGSGSTASGGDPSSPSKPGMLQRRAASDSTTNTMDTAQTNLSAIHAEESYTGGMGDKKTRSHNGKVNVSVAGFSSTNIHPKREEMAVQVVNALLDAYPKAIRVDSEGGRLPLHTACAGRATPRVVSTLVTAYSSAARHRNKDGFLPLHLAAHWGVSHPNVAVILLKAYPDATVGRNRWERTPLEEALCMAGENGRPHQAALVRALRKHPNYWIQSPDVFAVPQNNRASSSGGGSGSSNRRGGHKPVDIDESLPSNDTSTEDEERRYMQFGHEFLIDPEYVHRTRGCAA